MSRFYLAVTRQGHIQGQAPPRDMPVRHHVTQALQNNEMNDVGFGRTTSVLPVPNEFRRMETDHNMGDENMR